TGGFWTGKSLHEGLEAAFWMEFGRLKMRLLYPDTFGRATAAAMGQTLFTALGDLCGQSGENSRAARYIPADFAASGLTEADLAAILSQISGQS
ncbi:MAG: hypothetical protein LBP33_12890, partial [Candidatus Adiutrix sp.]|nr:hypothetical protein [Candidatus Adiutrix sp.]